MGGALLHVLNHSLFKPLLFMGAGNILHGTRTRRIDRLGGLAKTMPATFAYVALGAIAICGLPPLNGFVSELLIYMGLFRAAMLNMGRMCVWAALAAPALAMIGALALGAFIKWIGTGFGGLPRTRAAMTAHEAGKTMLGPMAALAAGCVIIGMTPMVMMPLIERGVAVWDSRPGEAGVSISGLVPLHWFTIGAIALVAAVLSTGAVIAMCRRRNAGETAGKTVGTWDCGYARPTAAMQYTGSSFGQTPAKMFGWLLLPRRAFWGPSGLFAGRSYFSSETPDTVLDRGLVPAFSLGQRVLSWVRPMQQGPVQIYLFYMLAILIGLLMFGGWTK
jgi:hydrogenase-4 component B